MKLKLKQRVETIENALNMMDLFQQIKYLKPSKSDLLEMSKRLVDHNSHVYVEGTTYLDVYTSIMEQDYPSMHVCLQHQEDLTLWQSIVDGSWRN